MKILALSDTHLDKPSNVSSTGEDSGEILLNKAHRLAMIEKPDVVLHGGDLVDPEGTHSIRYGLERLREVYPDRTCTVLWVIGNNDLEMLPPDQVPNYARLLQEIADRFSKPAKTCRHRV